jgi:hypothetical protein
MTATTEAWGLLSAYEYICQQGNYATDLMVHPEDLKAVGKTSPIVP